MKCRYLIETTQRQFKLTMQNFNKTGFADEGLSQNKLQCVFSW